ncbi:hypothetical protein IWX91DRAFT_331799 [Phyllosticta citricarpa]
MCLSQENICPLSCAVRFWCSLHSLQPPRLISEKPPRKLHYSQCTKNDAVSHDNRRSAAIFLRSVRDGFQLQGQLRALPAQRRLLLLVSLVSALIRLDLVVQAVDHGLLRSGKHQQTTHARNEKPDGREPTDYVCMTDPTKLALVLQVLDRLGHLLD